MISARSVPFPKKPVFIFGSTAHPWRTDDFEAVDDRIRGGKSTSHLVATEGGLEAKFDGVLDIKALGGAGFASQSCRRAISLPADQYSSLVLTIRRPIVASPSARSPTNFVLSLKTAVPAKRPDGRRESVVTYEYRFSTSDTFTDADTTAEHDGGISTLPSIRIFEADWSSFEPTYRGRPAPDAPALDPSEIKEISFMCRSDFGNQEGKFELILVNLAARPLLVENSKDGEKEVWDEKALEEGTGATKPPVLQTRLLDLVRQIREAVFSFFAGIWARLGGSDRNVGRVRL